VEHWFRTLTCFLIDMRKTGAFGKACTRFHRNFTSCGFVYEGWLQIIWAILNQYIYV